MSCLINIWHSIYFYVKNFANQGPTLMLASWPVAFDIFCQGQLMQNMFGTVFKISLGKLSAWENEGNDL